MQQTLLFAASPLFILLNDFSSEYRSKAYNRYTLCYFVEVFRDINDFCVVFMLSLVKCSVGY